MSDWTLGAVKARGMEINALCENQACRHLFTFNLEALIEGAGADFPLADIPPMDCPACGGGPLVIRISFVEPQRDEES
ncbi:MAG: hypothetical protein ACXWVI_05375 [Methyloceanibacter sp.]